VFIRPLTAMVCLISGAALAATTATSETPCEQKPTCPLKKPVKRRAYIAPKPKPAPAPKPMVAVTPAPVPKADPCCDANKGKMETNVTNTNVNRFNISLAPQAAKPAAVRERIVERVRIKTEVRPVLVSNPNRFLILAGVAKTKAYAEVDPCNCSADAKSKHQVDLGLMYVRDFSRLSVGVAGTLRQGLYLAGGFNF
jgi:hypothetical protein